MKRIVQGSAVAAAGVTLMLGGLGTYALWHDDAALADTSLSSGELGIIAKAATWEDVSAPGPARWTPGDLVVPGDVLRMTQTFEVTATGKNMKGMLTFRPGTVTDSGFGSHITVTAKGAAGAAFSSITPGSAWSFDAPVGTRTVTATVEYAFDPATTNKEAQNATSSMAGSTFSLDQTRS